MCIFHYDKAIVEEYESKIISPLFVKLTKIGLQVYHEEWAILMTVWVMLF